MRALKKVNLDFPLLFFLACLISFGCFILYSASDESQTVLVNQFIRIAIGLICLIIVAQIPMRYWKILIPWLFIINVILLILTLFFGAEGKGAERWLDLGVFRFQPSETIKVLLPILIAKILSESGQSLKFSKVGIALVVIVLVGFLIVKQPDLGTAILVSASGIFVIFLSAIPWIYIIAFVTIVLLSLPVAWQFLLHDYQKERVMIFLNPQIDSLGAGYHIIQSKIAIGSGGVDGKGWLNGTQSQLEFLPERSTDFIFAVLSEEFGLNGVIILLAIYLFIISRGLYIGTQAQETFSRLIAGAIVLTFFVYLFVNMGMVTGLLPVVGLPLPLVSYGGTSMVTLLAGFGILMSVYTHRKLVSS